MQEYSLGGVACPSGGIGRRARFRFLSRQLGGGSNPLSGIPVVGAYQFHFQQEGVSSGVSESEKTMSIFLGRFFSLYDMIWCLTDNSKTQLKLGL